MALDKDTEFDHDKEELPRNVVHCKVHVNVGGRKVPLRQFFESLPRGAVITFPDTPGIRKMRGTGPVTFRVK